MINFIDEKGVKHSAIVECKKTKGVNGEKSLSGTIYTNDEILEGIGRGWRLEFENEKYCLTYVYPIDEGNRIVVEFDAVHEFFFDLNKKVVYSELNGSNTAKAYLDLIFNGSGYSYVIEVNIPAFEKEGFGMRNRLDLFKDFISSTGVEFSVNGKVVRILEKVGSNLSTIVKKGFNLNELRIEKDPGSFITYKKGFGAWVDDDDHSKGRLEVEYLSPLASVYGKLEGDPIVDERYKVASNFETRLKNDVELSYGISVDIDMEDLTKAGYEYEQPHEGDYIMAINKDLGFEQKIRIMSYETSYDTDGNIIDHKVACGSDNIIRKSIKEYDDFRKEIQAGLEGAISTSNKAWVSANGKTTVFEGPDEPTATAIGDMWFQIDGDKKIMRIWNGYEWKPVFNPGVIEETIKDLDGELELATTNANDAVNKAEQAIRDAGFANSAITATDGQVASLERNLNGFQAVVQDTYANKTTVTELATQWTQTTDLANGHTSQITSMGEAINLRLTKAQVADEILNDKTAIKDRETTNDSPQYYYDNYQLQKVREYKNITALGLTGNYAGLLETASQGVSSPWPTFKQTFYTSTYTYSRSAINGSTWGSWAKVVDSSNVLTQINLSEEGVLIQGKNIWLDGNTKINDAVIKTAHIADLAVNGAKIADATIGSAKIISLDASKITANALSAITTNTGDLYVSGDLTMTTDNTFIKGSFNYGDPYNGAHNPRYFANGQMMIGRQNIQYEANVHAVKPDNSIGAWKYFGNAYFGPDTVKLRNLKSPNGVVNATTSIYGGEIVVASDYEGIDNGVTISSAAGGRITALGGATIGGGIDPSIYSDSFQINGTYRNNIAKMHLSNGPQGASFNWDNGQGFADLFIGRDSSPVIWSNSVYDRTYSQAANMVINTDGSFGRASSASRYKLNISEIENLDQLAYNLLTVEPKRWNDKRETEAIAHEMNTGEDKVRDSLHLRQYHGLIAEDLRAAGLDPYISYNNKTGAIDGIEYDRLWTLLLPIIKKHQEDILELQLKMGVA